MSPASRTPILASGGKFTRKFFVIIDVAAILLFFVVLYFLLGKDVTVALRAILGLFFLLFLPGYILCWVIFPNGSEIDTVERLGLSFGLSIPLTLTWVLVLDKVFNVPLTALNIVLGLGAFLGVLSAVVFVRFVVTRKKVEKK